YHSDLIGQVVCDEGPRDCEGIIRFDSLDYAVEQMMGGNPGKLMVSKASAIPSTTLGSNSSCGDAPKQLLTENTINSPVAFSQASDQNRGIISPGENDIMIVLYDFMESMKSQISIKRGELVRLLSYSPAGDWSEVEACGFTHVMTHPPTELGPNTTTFSENHFHASSDGSSHHEAPGGTISATGSGCETSCAMVRSSQTKYRRGWVPTSYLAPAHVFNDPRHNRFIQQQPFLPTTGAAILGPVSDVRLPQATQSTFPVQHSEHTAFYITNVHRFPSVVQLIDHHSRSADGLVSPLLYSVPKHPIPSPPVNQAPYSSIAAHAIPPFTGPPHPQQPLSYSPPGHRAPVVELTHVHEPISSQAHQPQPHPRDGSLPLGPPPTSVHVNSFASISPGFATLDEWEVNRDEILMRQKLGESVCLSQDVNVNDFLKEAAIMKKLRHRNLVQLLGKSTMSCVF
ncbi:hypothetical protein AHF37_05555, partial [Paragonimus kellicotti]